MQLLADGAPVPEPAIEIRAPGPVGERASAAALVELDRADALLAAPAPDRKRLVALLRHASVLDPSSTGAAVLALAQAEADSAARDRLLEAATLFGDGAALPSMKTADAADGLALAQLLAWSERSQADRLVAAKLPERMRPAVQRFAAASGATVEECLACLRQVGSAQRTRLCERLRLAALRALDPAAAGWLGAIAAGDASRVPEGDSMQPWRFVFPGD